jgi:hypothetical protein
LDLHDTVTVISSPAQLTESNLKILDARERKAHNMLSTLRRRTLSTPQQVVQPALANTTTRESLTRNAARRTTLFPITEEVMQLDYESRKSQWKRHSAPADLMPKDRIGFEKPAFAYPGAF